MQYTVLLQKLNAAETICYVWDSISNPFVIKLVYYDKQTCGQNCLKVKSFYCLNVYSIQNLAVGELLHIKMRLLVIFY